MIREIKFHQNTRNFANGLIREIFWTRNFLTLSRLNPQEGGVYLSIIFLLRGTFKGFFECFEEIQQWMTWFARRLNSFWFTYLILSSIEEEKVTKTPAMTTFFSSFKVYNQTYLVNTFIKYLSSSVPVTASLTFSNFLRLCL